MAVFVVLLGGFVFSWLGGWGLAMMFLCMAWLFFVVLCVVLLWVVFCFLEPLLAFCWFFVESLILAQDERWRRA